MERLTKRGYKKQALLIGTSCSYGYISYDCKLKEGNELLKSALDKLADYEDLEEQGRLIKLPIEYKKGDCRECVHTKTQCHHMEYKCSECPLTELLCDEFYLAIDRCYEDAYASGCLAGMDLAKSEVEAKLKEYESLEKQGRLVILPCKYVYYIVDINNPRYASVAKRFIKVLAICEIESIDKENCKYFSTKEKAEARLKELRGGEDE